MKLLGANLDAEVSGLEQLPGKVNYFIGNDSKKWRTDVPTYTKVEYEDVYPGVKLLYYGNQGKLEYDFVVSPGADPKTIQIAFEGVDSLRTDDKDDLILRPLPAISACTSLSSTRKLTVSEKKSLPLMC